MLENRKGGIIASPSAWRVCFRNDQFESSEFSATSRPTSRPRALRVVAPIIGRMWHRSHFACLLLALLTIQCGGSDRSTPTAPTTPSTPAPSGPELPAIPANVSGTWSGSFESSAGSTRRIVLLAFQGGTCVDGAWRTEPAEWVGAISGYAAVGSFSGSITLQSADGSNRCSGVGTVSGNVSGNTIQWTSTGFTGQCPGGMPQDVTIVLRRE